MTVRKDIFYRCLKDKKDGRIFAEKTTGYSEGDIGLHSDIDSGGDRFWMATHIPTGRKLTPTANKTARLALSEAKRIIAAVPEFDKRIQETMDTEEYKTFTQSRYAQECFTVL
jgi:hypothetical protein